MHAFIHVIIIWSVMRRPVAGIMHREQLLINQHTLRVSTPPPHRVEVSLVCVVGGDDIVGVELELGR